MNALTNTGSRSLAPTNLPEAMRFADMLASSTMVPRDYQGKPANVLVAMQWGFEVGLSPLQALQNIAVINGRPSIWGDAALALVQAHPSYAAHKEWVEGEGDQRAGYCSLTRRGHEPETRTFSVADAKRAGLWGKQGPWQQYPDRMLQLRARGFAIRDKFADALRGIITREEAEDTPEPALPPSRGPQIDHAEPAETPWPALSPSMGLIAAKDSRQWRKWSETAIAKIDTAETMAAWMAGMAPHLAAAAERDPDAAEAVRNAAQDRMDMLAGADAGEVE